MVIAAEFVGAALHGARPCLVPACPFPGLPAPCRHCQGLGKISSNFKGFLGGFWCQKSFPVIENLWEIDKCF